MSRTLAVTVPRRPPDQTRHDTGSSRTLAERTAGHMLGRGVRLTRVQLERDGWRVLTQNEPEGTS